jgi:NAD(P)-dependent dehydrogenase (short-subunit alcohol dehydrogenase family)
VVTVRGETARSAGHSGQQRRLEHPPRAALIAETSDANYDQMMAVNTRAAFALIREANTRLPDHGRMINISTLCPAVSGG